MAISNFYHLETEDYEGGYQSPLEVVREWRKRPNTRIFVSKWATPEGEGEEGLLIGEPIDITHLALHLIEDERERGQRRVR